jgi:hypothetical protein
MTTILEEAQDIIHGERNRTYGHPREQFALAAKLWSDYLGVEVTPDDHAAMMVLLKLSRVKTGGYHRDAAVDIAGYAGTMERLRELPDEYVDLGHTTRHPAPTGPGQEALEHGITWLVDGRRYWSAWADIPAGTRVNSSDEEDRKLPWTKFSNDSDNPLGEGPWREWIDPDEAEVVPAQWKRVRRVPVGTEVTDVDGDFYLRVRNGFKYRDATVEDWGNLMPLSVADDHDDEFGPFTQVIA